MDALSTILDSSDVIGNRFDAGSADRFTRLPISSFTICLPRWSAMPQRTASRSYRGRHNTALHD
ncbi:hypothetical protein ASG56_10475 [Rhodococcus sp. Leaf7]|nr:hypothetical protein ASG56_10475 [Rhodococcus sp. Leaf7]KQU40051.1 hypothetical protein ASG64_10470 [Rhodococcus sp. Leaf247]